MIDDKEELRTLITRFGDKAAQAAAKADAAFLEVHGLAGNSGIKEEVAELRANQAHFNKELDNVRQSIKDLGESLRAEMRSLGTRVDRAIWERVIFIVVALLIGASSLKSLMQ
jgi:DNA gyrase/topoisomerase IV subunit A